MPPRRGDRAAPDLPGELRAMLRDVDAADGIRRILDRVAVRLDASAVLVEPDGSTTPPGRILPEQLAADLEAVSTGRVDAVSGSVDGRAVCLLAIGGPTPAPVLAVRGRDAGLSPAARTLLAEATVPLGLAWRMRETRLHAARLERAEARNRETVLHLLLAGGTSGARLAAAALGPVLPETLRIHLVECAGRRLDDAVRWCAEAAGGSAWIVRCPVYRRHVVVVARADADDLVDALRTRAASDPGYHVGSSHEAMLTGFAAAYRHAFHALSVARHRPERYAAFHARGELAEILAGAGSGWAARVLAPLHAYRPARGQDPDAEALVFTLSSWLTFHAGAVRHLKVHRNTLTARLRLVESLLGVDLRDVGTQARLHLALQLAGPGDQAVTFEELMSRPEVRYWADRQREPLRGNDPRLVDTLRTWLVNGARIGPTAAALGVSPSGVRKRLVRVEQLTQRALLDSPSARYDLLLALDPTAGDARAGATVPVEVDIA